MPFEAILFLFTWLVLSFKQHTSPVCEKNLTNRRSKHQSKRRQHTALSIEVSFNNLEHGNKRNRGRGPSAFALDFAFAGLWSWRMVLFQLYGLYCRAEYSILGPRALVSS